MCLALRSLVCKVKRTLAIVGSWIGVQLSLSTKYGFDSLAPQHTNTDVFFGVHNVVSIHVVTTDMRRLGDGV